MLEIARRLTALASTGCLVVGLAGCGMALNDALDARHDRAFAPDKVHKVNAARPGQRHRLVLTLERRRQHIDRNRQLSRDAFIELLSDRSVAAEFTNKI